jgi:hypothetical protein
MLRHVIEGIEASDLSGDCRREAGDVKGGYTPDPRNTMNEIVPERSVTDSVRSQDTKPSYYNASSICHGEALLEETDGREITATAVRLQTVTYKVSGTMVRGRWRRARMSTEERNGG